MTNSGLGDNLRKNSFAVITVVRDDLAGLKKSRASLELQTYKNWIHIIVDGASTDDTLKYLKSLPKENTIFISEPDDGIYNAMNKAWKLASPDDYVFYLNARDTFVNKTAMGEASKALNLAGNPLWGCTTHEEIEPNGDGWVCKLVSPPSISNQLFAFGYRSHQGVVMRARFIARLGGFDESYKIASDWDLIVRALQNEVPIVWREPLALFELGGMSSTRILEAHLELKQLRFKYLSKSWILRLLDDFWCSIYLNYFGYTNYLSWIARSFRVVGKDRSDIERRKSELSIQALYVNRILHKVFKIKQYDHF